MKTWLFVLFLLPVFCSAQRPPIGSFNFRTVKQSAFNHIKMEFEKVSEDTNADVTIAFDSNTITISDVRGRIFKIINIRNKSGETSSYIYDYLLRDQFGKIYKLTTVLPKEFPKTTPDVSFYFMPTKDGYFDRATSYSNN